MFRGRYKHTIDAKGRISIPSKFRDVLNKKYDDRLVLTNLDGCLVGFPYEEWSILEQKVGTFSLVKKETSAFFRFFFSSAVDCPIDKLGRVLIPQELRDYAGLKKDVVFVGEGKRIEIFAKDRWEEEAKKAEEDFGQSREHIGNLGI